jgi:hypothetical protein
MDLGQPQAWGLTLGQTLVIVIGGFMLLGGWVLATSVFKLSKNMVMCGLVAIFGLMCCASTMFAIYEFTR